MSSYAHALNVVMHRRLCEHEAGHCAAALIGGLNVTRARADFHDLTVEPADPDAAARVRRHRARPGSPARARGYGLGRAAV